MGKTESRERIILLGPDSPVKQMVQKAYEQTGGRDWRVSCTQQDAVFLFGCYDPERDSETSVQWFEELAAAIDQVQQMRPKRVLFVSDTMVYGKLYGKQRLVREDEIGYISHTSRDEMTAQWMRMAEHLCSRLAREEALSIRIVRADWQRILTTGSMEDRSAAVRSLFRFLTDAAEDGAYNLPAFGAEQQAEKNAESRSPLSPIALILDTGKAERNVAS